MNELYSKNSIIPTQRSVFNYANFSKGGYYHQFNTNKSGVSPVPNANQINLSSNNRRILFASNYDGGFDNFYDYFTVFNGSIQATSRNLAVANGGDAIGPVDIPTSTFPISVDANRGIEDVYKIVSNHVIKIPESSITYFEIRDIFKPYTLSTTNTNTSFGIKTLKGGVPTFIGIENWNIDNFGYGIKKPSGISLDFSKIQTLAIEVNSRGRGSIRIGFLIGNQYYFGHEIETNNLETKIPFGNLNLPISEYTRKTGANELTRDVGFFDENSGFSFTAITDTTIEPSSIYSYRSYSKVAYAVGDEIKNKKRPFSVDTGATPITATPASELLFAIRPTANLSGVKNKTVYSVDSFTVTTRTPNLEDEVFVDFWWNIGGFNETEWNNVDGITGYSGLEFNKVIDSLNLQHAKKIGTLRVKGSAIATFNTKDILTDYENSFSNKNATFNAADLTQNIRGTIALIVTSMPTTNVAPIEVSAILQGGEIA